MKLKFGAIVVAGSGKIGGHVASKNRSGAYLRTKVTPTNPNTPAQAGARSLLASLSTAWSGLSESQRLGWNGAVKDFATTDIFGDIKNPSGINLFVKLNCNLVKSGQNTIDDVPAKQEIFFSNIASVVFSVGTPANSKITFADGALDNTRIVISATPVVSAGTSFVKSQYRNITSVEVSTQEASYGPDYISKFGNMNIGDKIFVSVQPVGTNGQVGVPQSIAVIAVA